MMTFNNIPVFVVNLETRADRLANAAAQLERYGIDYSVWQAIKNDNGRLGIVKTIKELFEYALSNDFDALFVLEDDFKILEGNKFVETFNKCLEQLPQDFDLFYPGCNLHGKFVKYSDNLLAAEGMYAAHSVVYSRTAMQEISRYLKSDETVIYDVLLANPIQQRGKSYCSFPLLISQEPGYSDIEKRVVQYDKFLEKRFAEKTKHLGH